MELIDWEIVISMELELILIRKKHLNYIKKQQI
jgi:TPR repeat protein